MKLLLICLCVWRPFEQTVRQLFFSPIFKELPLALYPSQVPDIFCSEDKNLSAQFVCVANRFPFQGQTNLELNQYVTTMGNESFDSPCSLQIARHVRVNTDQNPYVCKM